MGLPVGSGARLWTTWSLVAAVVLAGGWLLVRAMLSGKTGEPKDASSALAADEGVPTPNAWPGPARLRDGARQISDPRAAEEEGRKALARVEAELAVTQDPVAVQRLERKREMIRQAMGRFEGTAGL